jgi:hypothetical protein
MRIEVIQMIKVSIEVRYKTARFAVGVQARSIQHALSIVAARYPKSVARVRFPIDSEGFFLEDSGSRERLIEAFA